MEQDEKRNEKEWRDKKEKQNIKAAAAVESGRKKRIKPQSWKLKKRL